ncbi:MAG TPA: hypothetical protein VEJ20_07085 [Candidatus Eremiobacteraceae bacterium]|nr:hypothetical protein [Candidatus Eremiobacteraceae bacterium]
MHPLDTAGFVVRLAAGAAASGATWIVAVDAGDLVLHALRIPRDAAGRSPIAAALGYAMLGSIVGVFALFHVASALLGVFVAVAAAVVLIERRALAFAARLHLRGWFDRFASATPIDRATSVITGLAFATAAVAAALPAVWWDPIAYHLPIVARAIAQHAFVFDPGMVQTGFPLLGEAAALPAYALAGSAGAAMTTLGSGIALALLAGAWSESVAAGSGRLATALVATSALWLWVAPSFYVDVPFALFAIGALAVTQIRWTQSNAWANGAIVAGALAGAAAATKYPGLIAGALALVLIALRASGFRARDCAVFVVGLLALAGGWYLRTALLTGDPFYPFLAAHGIAAPTIEPFTARYAAMTASWCGGGTTWSDALLLPWRLVADPRAFCGDAGYALDAGIIFVLLSFAFWRRLWAIAVCMVALTGAWFVTSQQWRFLLPAMCLFAILTAAGATIATARIRPLVVGVLLVLCLANVVVDWLPAAGSDSSNSLAPAYAYIAGEQTGDAYLSTRLESYDAAEWLRDEMRRCASAPAGASCIIATSAQIAALDDVRDYYFGAGVAWLNPYYQSRFALDWRAPPRDRYALLVAAGYRCLVIDEAPAFLARTPTGVDWDVLHRDERDGTLALLYSSNDVSVYELPGIAGAVRR